MPLDDEMTAGTGAGAGAEGVDIAGGAVADEDGVGRASGEIPMASMASLVPVMVRIASSKRSPRRLSSAERAARSASASEIAFAEDEEEEEGAACRIECAGSEGDIGAGLGTPGGVCATVVAGDTTIAGGCDRLGCKGASIDGGK